MIFVRNGIDLFKEQMDTEVARLKSKIYWDWTSVLDNQTHRELILAGDSLDACHLYPAGKQRFLHLRAIPANCFPMPRTNHIPWDKLSIDKKITALVNGASFENGGHIRKIITRLGTML